MTREGEGYDGTIRVSGEKREKKERKRGKKAAP